MTTLEPNRATRHKCAAFILRECLALNVRVGTNGDAIVVIAPMRVPREVRRQLELALDEYREEVIDLIQRENSVIRRRA